ncbi:flavin reductase family protein [Streptomyces thermolilacinus]|uniref:Flavin reductase n=1 Tax=Streptomyces thermolilacinus SPC6 TaxID=1306406 RepID=A0A1D3DMY4_9ACTN|nr:flavin reductase family protein [Streptomyces thermolilacinus]OEJ93679.1 flavin reductase [Streptomyces thermolilacinus SPC6]
MVTEREFKDFMAEVCTPVAVVTAMADGRPHGTTVGSLASLSLRPPMVTIALDHRSALLSSVRRAGRFGVNLLGAGQAGLARTFAAPVPDRFAEAAWYPDEGLPRLREAPGWLVCVPQRLIPGGDHVLLLSLVTRVGGTRAAAPLVYGRRTFGTHSAFTPRPGASITDQIAAFAR